MKVTRKDIIEQANKLFFEKGYNNVTIVDICNACQISKTSFYYHIKSKEEILLDFYDSRVHNISEQLITILSKDNYWEQFMACFEYLVDEVNKYGSDFLSQMMIMNLHENFGSFDFREELTNISVMLIKRGQESDQIRNKNKAEDLYKAAGYSALGYVLLWCINNGNLDWKKEMRKSFENIFDVAPEFRKN